MKAEWTLINLRSPWWRVRCIESANIWLKYHQKWRSRSPKAQPCPILISRYVSRQRTNADFFEATRTEIWNTEALHTDEWKFVERSTASTSSENDERIWISPTSNNISFEVQTQRRHCLFFSAPLSPQAAHFVFFRYYFVLYIPCSTVVHYEYGLGRTAVRSTLVQDRDSESITFGMIVSKFTTTPTVTVMAFTTTKG